MPSPFIFQCITPSSPPCLPDNNMTTQFYKFAVSLSQKLQSEGQCFTKVHKSIRKYRKVYLSSSYLYVISEEKVKYKMAILKIKKLIISQNSSECVIMGQGKALLIDDLALRQRIRKDLMNMNPNLQLQFVKETLLDEYVEGSKEGEKEESKDSMVLNLVRLRAQHEQFSNKNKEVHFYEMFSSIDLVDKEEDWMLITAEKLNLTKNEKKKFSSIFKREKKELFTIKIYQKKPIDQNKPLLNKILRERRFLEEILSPYTPVLHRCMYSRSSIYCVTQPYRGTRLKAYLQNQTLTKSQFRSLISQIVMALGQVHECNVVYNGISTEGIYMLDEGYIMLNDFSKSCQVNAEGAEIGLALKDIQPPQATNDKEEKRVNGCWDWWNLGHLIYFMKQGKRWTQGEDMPWQKQPELYSLANALVQSQPAKRLGYRNDYHEVLGHPYFKNINKKQLATRTCEPLKKFFTPNPQKINYASDGEDWSANDSYLTDYEYNRELE